MTDLAGIDRRAKVDLQLNLGRDVKHNKGSYKRLSSKMETGESVVTLLNGHTVENDKEKTKALGAAFTSGFASKTRLHEPLSPKTRGKV